MTDADILLWFTGSAADDSSQEAEEEDGEASDQPLVKFTHAEATAALLGTNAQL